jgi:hypothetical protein
VFGAQSVTFAWDPVTNADLAGYNVYYGSASHTYTNITSVGNVTNATISGLMEGATYYFAATALNTSGLESTFSDEVPYTVPNTVPILQVTPGSIAYGTLLVGTSKTNSFTVQNIGTGTLSGTASVAGAPFSIVSGGSYNLGAGQTQAVVVAFSPTVANNYNQSVTFTGGNGTNTTVTGSATNAPAPTPVLQVTPGSIGYGTLLVGTSKTNSFTVQNIGTGTLSGTASVAGAPFSIVSGGSYNLGAGQAQAVVVAFSPTVANNYNQSVTFTGGNGTNTTVTGSATNAPPVLPTVSAINVNTTDVDLSLPGLQIYVGTTVQFSATATNAQTWQWSYAINGGTPVVYTNSTSAITNISYFFDTNAISNSYVWTLVVSNGQAWAESQTNLEVEAIPNLGGGTTNTGLIFTAATGNLTGMQTYSAMINGVSSSYIYQPLQAIGDISSGTAVFNFTLPNAGNYEIEALVDAPNTDANSFYVNIDAPPQDPTMVWDIMPTTSGFEQRIVSWRGGGSENNDQIVPKVFSLGAGPHQIIFMGREPGTGLASFTLLQVIPAPTGPATSQGQPLATISSLNSNAQALTAFARQITGTPTNYVAVAGQTVTLNAVAMESSRSSASACQWQFNAVNLPTANNTTLTLKNVTTHQSGTYTLVVSDADGTTISSPVILTVYPTVAGTLAMASHSEGQFAMSVGGVPGYQYEVQASTNMVDWIPLQTNTAPYLFKDPNAGKFKQRFYRSVYMQIYAQ